MKYIYPAVFTEEETGGYSVSFPDIKGCYTCGNDLQEALNMAQDALCLMLYDLEELGKQIPKASAIKSITVNEKEFVNLIICDTIEYRKIYDKKAVKKTLSIPSWLNAMAEKNDINFSQLLQEALKKQLQL